MVLSDPPAPAVGIRNSLASSPTSNNVSQLAANLYHLSPPEEALAFPLSPIHVTAHAAGTRDIFASIIDSFLVFTDASTRETASCPTRLHIEPTDLSVSRQSTCAAMAAVAGYDGVFVSRFSNRQATALFLLLGSDNHPCVAVDVSDRGAIAAGSMAGQIAVWHQVSAEASTVIDVPGIVDLCDRITQLRFMKDGDIVVAWWSGLLMRYNINGDKAKCIWKITGAQRKSKEFCMFSGTFFVLVKGWSGERAIVTRGDGIVHFVHLATGVNIRQRLSLPQRRVVVKGLCTCAQGTYVWIRDSRRLFQIEWPVTDHDHEPCSSMPTRVDETRKEETGEQEAFPSSVAEAS